MEKHLKFLIIVVLMTLNSTVKAQENSLILYNDLPNHPRLLLFDEDIPSVKNNIKNDNNWRIIHNAIISEAEVMIMLPTLERIQVGRRLLDKSREALRRIYYLSYAYRLTTEKKYLIRAEQELLKVSQFSDWNPSHFLDVAEMTMAVAIGYDWLYKDLSIESKNIIETAILEKGIKQSFDNKYNGFLTASNNWNQVCNAGMTFGALAIFENNKEIASKTISRAIESIKLPMHDYFPSGAYPEGEGYWTYGTSFNVLFISALERIYKSDFGLNELPGFLKTADYKQHMIGESGFGFNYSDAGNNRKASFEPTIFWFASKMNKPSLIYEKDIYLKNNSINVNDRILPSIMFWGKDISFENIPTPKELFWQGDGKNPVALMRSSWTDSDAIFVGIKAGSPSVNHGHMDIGTFVMDALGERWALDLGMQDYESLESKGVKLWGKEQDSERWEVLRYNNRFHNTLTFDNEFQIVNGHSDIIQKTDDENFMSAVINMTPVYKNKVKEAKRGIALINKNNVVIKDEITTNGNSTTVRWAMLTAANINITKPNEAILTQNGKEVKIFVISPQNIQLKTWSTAPVHSYDAENEGTSIIGFESQLVDNQKYELTVMISPSKKSKKIEVKPLKDWK